MDRSNPPAPPEPRFSGLDVVEAECSECGFYGSCRIESDECEGVDVTCPECGTRFYARLIFDDE